jgi:hypothetical protein
VINCNVCNDVTRVRQIDAALRNRKVSYRALAEKFPPISQHSIRRHDQRGHVPPEADPGPPKIADDLASDDPLVVMRAIIADLRAVDVTKLAPGAKAAHYAELRRTVESLAKMDPATTAPQTVTMEEVAGLPEFVAFLAELLEPYPDVRRKLYARLEAENMLGVLG